MLYGRLHKAALTAFWRSRTALLLGLIGILFRHFVFWDVGAFFVLGYALLNVRRMFKPT